MTYQIQRMYYKNTNQTRVKLYQERPLREFEVMLDGDLGKLGDFQIEDMAKKELAKEFNPVPVLNELEKMQEDLKNGQDEIMMTLADLFEKVVGNEQAEEVING
ncbi:hypothetical protein [uncultured Anaerococcus sp.]|uniref:hypothetical protein n=1 Tax=uncultured Anaerococcus sp. TaxID=293428 RepID=UPI002606F1A2|nr:hypothetical protein [uncultured Anaerococcus sp.]